MKIVVTAGPTREYLDPVRFLSNPSTGKMGFAVAAEAARCGHDVTLIAGPVALKTPSGVRRVDVVSAREMLEKSLESLKHPNTQTVFVSTAAVADWRPATCAAQKLKKREMSSTLKLVRNPDILKTISQLSQRPNLLLVGFAAETNDVLAEAARKCREKGLAFIVANDVTEAGSGFGTATDRVTFVYPDGRQEKFPLMTKRRVAAALVRTVERLSADGGAFLGEGPGRKVLDCGLLGQHGGRVVGGDPPQFAAAPLDGAESGGDFVDRARHEVNPDGILEEACRRANAHCLDAVLV